jgi:DHA1 family bicyclomycin/chloramphenicol resistance-like MFS transporter
MLPLGFYAFGMSLATPGLLLTGLDQFPQMRGLAASCQAFAMVLLAGLVTQLAPTFGGRALALGLVQGVLCIAAFASWLVTIPPYSTERTAVSDTAAIAEANSLFILCLSSSSCSPKLSMAALRGGAARQSR